MKKSLLAVAVAAALPAVAYAQSNVTLYGMLDTGYMSKKFTDNGTLHSKSVGFGEAGGVPSMLGFRGTEDLGGGLKAEWVVEMGWSPNSQEMFNVRTINAGHQVDGLTPAQGGGRSHTSLNRQSFVGLNGGLGTVRVGYQRTNFYDMSTYMGYTLCNEGVQGCQAHIAGGGPASMIGGSRGNGMTYISPKLGGLTIQAQYGSGVDLNEYRDISTTLDHKVERVGLMANWVGGPLSLGAGYTQLKAGTNTTAASAATPITTSGKAYQLAAAYRLSMATIGATFVKANNGGLTAATELDTRAYQISASVPVSPAVELYAGIGKTKIESAAGVTTNDDKNWQIGSRYRFSKRTFAYLHYGQDKDDGAVAIDKKTQLGFGLAHIF